MTAFSKKIEVFQSFDFIGHGENQRTISVWKRCFVLYTFQPCCSCHCHNQGFWMVCRQSWERNQASTRHIPLCLGSSDVIPHILLFCMLILKCCWWNKSCTTCYLWNPMKNVIMIFSISTGTGFLPSTVCPMFFCHTIQGNKHGDIWRRGIIATLGCQFGTSQKPTESMLRSMILSTHACRSIIKGQWGVPLTYVYLWYLLCSLGILGDKYPLYRAYIGISHRSTLVGVHPTIPWYNPP